MTDPTPAPEPTPEPEPTPAPEPERTFTQAELDRHVQDRLARERKKYEGFDDLQAKAARLDEIEAANATELEKAQARADKLQQELEAAQAAARQTALRSTLLAEAAKADRKIVDPDGALAFLTGVDSELLELDNDGNPVDIAKAMDALLEKRPYLVDPEEKARPGGADQGARGGGKNQLAADALKGMSPEEIVKARREGRLDTVLGGS